MVVDTIKLDIPGEVQRMNNVFKIYFQVWSLYAVSATYALWWAIGRWRNHDAAPARRSWSVEFRGAWATAVGALVFGAMFYPLLATPERTADRFHPLPLTKDGMAYMQHTVYQTDRGPLDLKQDYDGIQWLRNNVQGSPVVLEAVTPIYQWGSRISIYTGLPTVLGWDWHQTQQRWDTRESIERRKIDVTSIYTSPVPADALALLRRYQVSYIYVGQLERQHYPAVGIDKFATMATQGALERVYQNDQVSIYKVRG